MDPSRPSPASDGRSADDDWLLAFVAEAANLDQTTLGHIRAKLRAGDAVTTAGTAAGAPQTDPPAGPDPLM